MNTRRLAVWTLAFQFIGIVSVYAFEISKSEMDLNAEQAIEGTRAVTGPGALGVENFFRAGDQLFVEIELNNTTSSALTAELEEILPIGWAVSDISDEGVESEGAIRWEFSINPGVKIVQYTLTAPSDSESRITFSGTVNGFELVPVGIGQFEFVGAAMGIFDAHKDIGDTPQPGYVTYDPNTGEYELTATGSNIWDRADGFHFLFTELSGAFSFKARIELDPLDGDAQWVKTGLMIRDHLAADSKHFSNFIRTDKQQYTTWREWDSGSSDSTSGKMNPDWEGELELVRRDKTIEAYYTSLQTGERVLANTFTLDLEDPVYVGLALSSNTDGYSIATFRDVALSQNLVGTRVIAGPDHFGARTYYQEGDSFQVTGGGGGDRDPKSQFGRDDRHCIGNTSQRMGGE